MKKVFKHEIVSVGMVKTGDVKLEKLLGQIVVFGDTAFEIEKEYHIGTLDAVTPMGFIGGGSVWKFCALVQDPMKALQPFDLSDPSVRKSLHGRWIRYKDDGSETAISGFSIDRKTGEWLVDCMTEEEFLAHCEIINDNGTLSPCGVIDIDCYRENMDSNGIIDEIWGPASKEEEKR